MSFKRFANIYEFCNKDINKSILLLRTGVCAYEYTDSLERFDETSLRDKEAFYSSLNREDITDVDHMHAKRIFKNFNNKNLGDYHDLYVQYDTLLLANVDILLMVEKGIRCGICHAIHRYAEVYNK